MRAFVWTVCCTLNYFPCSSDLTQWGIANLKHNPWCRSQFFKHICRHLKVVYSFSSLTTLNQNAYIFESYLLTSAEIVAPLNFSTICCTFEISSLSLLIAILTAFAFAQLCVHCVELELFADGGKVLSLVQFELDSYVAAEYVYRHCRVYRGQFQ